MYIAGQRVTITEGRYQWFNGTVKSASRTGKGYYVTLDSPHDKTTILRADRCQPLGPVLTNVTLPAIVPVSTTGKAGAIAPIGSRIVQIPSVLPTVQMKTFALPSLVPPPIITTRPATPTPGSLPAISSPPEDIVISALRDAYDPDEFEAILEEEYVEEDFEAMVDEYYAGKDEATTAPMEISKEAGKVIRFTQKPWIP